MKLAELFGKGRTVFSCEVFPPKKTSPVDSIYKTLDGLRDIHPDFISVTFGAGGSQVNQSTREIAGLIQNQYHIPAMAHLTCVAAGREDVDRLLEERGEPQVRNGAKLADLLRRPRLTYADLAPFDPDRPDLAPAVASEAEITIKYEGYIQRQLRQVEEVKRLEARPLPADLDYQSIQGLRLEARQKLNDIRPQNLGQASRVSGVSPADVAVLMVYLKQNNSI